MSASAVLAGSVRWAVVPFTPRPPFRIYAGVDQEPFEVDSAEKLVQAAFQPGGDASFTFLVPAKARPVLILNDPPVEHHREVLALRLLRLTKLPAEGQATVRAGDDELLLYLPPERFALEEENAAMLSAPVRLHAEAIDTRRPAAGTLSAEEQRVLADRLIRYLRFDTQLLVERRLRQLAEAIAERE